MIDLLGFGFAAHVLLFLDESSQLLLESHIFAVDLLDEGMLQEVGHGRTCLKIFYQTPDTIKKTKSEVQLEKEKGGGRLRRMCSVT